MLYLTVYKFGFDLAYVEFFLLYYPTTVLSKKKFLVYSKTDIIKEILLYLREIKVYCILYRLYVADVGNR